MCEKARVEQLAGDPDASNTALAEAESLAPEIGVTPESELGQTLSSRALVTGPRPCVPRAVLSGGVRTVRGTTRATTSDLNGPLEDSLLDTSPVSLPISDLEKPPNPP